MHAIIMAGGKGSRLGILTRNRPKPLMKVGDYSILEIIVLQLRAAGFNRISLCVSHLGEMIQQHFGDGERFGVTIEYSWDRRPLGTAAPLRLVPQWNTPALVMNGDILAALDFGALFALHQRNRAAMTVAVRRTHIPVEYGVLDFAADGRVLGVQEKPRLVVDFSSGIYVIDPSMRSYIPPDLRMDMPDLLTAAIAHGEDVRASRTTGDWHDIGTALAYRSATDAFLANPAEYIMVGHDLARNAPPS